MKNEHPTHLNASLVWVNLEMASLMISHKSAKPQILEYRSMFEKPFQYMRTFLFMQEEGSRLCTQSPQVPSSPHSSNVTNQPTNLGTNQTNNQMINNQPTNQPTNKPTYQTTIWPTKQLTDRPSDPPPTYVPLSIYKLPACSLPHFRSIDIH